MSGDESSHFSLTVSCRDVDEASLADLRGKMSHDSLLYPLDPPWCNTIVYGAVMS